ncbi:MAG: adaptor protein MecA [Clostridium sp.]|jgi:adapter protein MecA 1/2|nr:adaptor protein MecA [Clostridium sp.]
MRFEKITDNKIKIFFSFDDMNKNHISRKILFSNNAFSQNFIQSVLKSAEENLNFKIENENILIEILNYNDGCVFTVTKVDSNFIENIGNNIFYKFNKFEDFLDFCTYIKNMNWSVFESFSLFLLNSTYYLHSFNNISNNLDSILCEFSTKKDFSSRIFRYFK